MSSLTWKYVENQFESATRESRVAMNSVVQDHFAKLTAAVAQPGADSRLGDLLTDFTPRKMAWGTAFAQWRNFKAGYGGGTQAVEGLLRLLNISPGPEQTSKIENWDSRIRAVVPHNGAVYRTLLPEGRAEFAEGHREEVIDSVKDLGTRLGAQTDHPELVALGVEVTGFYNQLDVARTSQQGLEGSTDSAATSIEASRKTIATALYGDLGMLMHIYQDTPATVASFFDLDTLRTPPTAKAESTTGTTTTPPASA